MTTWLPVAPCDQTCVAHALPPVSTTDTVVRCARLVAAVARAGSAAIAPRDERVRTVAVALLRALGVRLDASTDHLRAPGQVGTLVVANHTSWLDVVALLAVEPATFLAKREVANWPVLGRLAGLAGTRFLDRANLRELPAAVAALATLLRTGRSVVVFPEATSWCGPPGGVFRRACFQAAIDAGAPVRPVTITYQQAAAPTTIAAFVGADTLLASLRRILAARDLVVDVHAHPPIAPTIVSTMDRRRLATRAQAAVREAHRGEPAHA